VNAFTIINFVIVHANVVNVRILIRIGKGRNSKIKIETKMMIKIKIKTNRKRNKIHKSVQKQFNNYCIKFIKPLIINVNESSLI
jgi:hypothetical protein